MNFGYPECHIPNEKKKNTFNIRTKQKSLNSKIIRKRIIFTSEIIYGNNEYSFKVIHNLDKLW